MRPRISMWSRNHLGVNLLLSLVASSLSLSFFGIHGQLDSLGFISIDCGYTGPNYTDSETGITYVSDEGFTDDYAGLMHTLNVSNMVPNIFPQWTRRYKTIRIFPNGTRNCYTLRQLTPGGKYLVRAVFVYDNYDMRNWEVVFDLYLGVNYWMTVDFRHSQGAFTCEIIVESPANYLQVCLINTGSGAPFISGLDLRQFEANFYPHSNATQSLVFSTDTFGLQVGRYHFGTHSRDDIRYPDDRYDRIWQRYEDMLWKIVQDIINGTVKNYPNDTYGAPSAVMRSVSTPVDDSEGMTVGWIMHPTTKGMESLDLLYVLYFTEVEILQEKEFREFSIFLDDLPLVGAFRPEQMLTTVVAGTCGHNADSHSVYLEPTTNSKPPLISAMEIYSIRPMDGSATDSGDASAMMTIKTKYSIDRIWAGDPCLPLAYVWDGLNCTYNTTSARGGLARIIALYLSSSELNGEIDPSFGKLTLLQHLDLSHNNLSGPIPNFLGELPSLRFLDLSSNNLSGPIPTNLLQKSQNGLLTLRTTDNNMNPCTNPAFCDPVPNKKKSLVPNKKKSIVTATVTVGIALLALFLAFTIWYKRKRTKEQGPKFLSQDQGPQTVWAEQALQSMVVDHQGPQPAGIKQDPQLSFLVDNHAADGDMLTGLHFRNFRYKELWVITRSFENKIAEGGFGPVYAGKLDNGTPVAVKMRSQDSSQGDKEFWTEVKHLARLCHENLVPLLGYCKDEEHLGLVYEYMAGGNVEQRLRGGTTGQEAPLTWSQRLKVALDSARGLNYLHSALRTPLIHRDVKARNILLTEKLEAKISDLGLARAISSEEKTHTITGTLSGTPGYVDPEYLKAGELRGKTDVYSFGIVLLVLITARPTTVTVGDKHVNIADWVREMLSQCASAGSDGDISSVIDPSIRGQCDDLVSVRKVAELALRCAEREDVHARPTMAEVVSELEALQQRDDWASAAETSGRSAMAVEEEEDEAAVVAGVHEAVHLAEAQ